MIQQIEFVKMHGLGNDFVIIDQRIQNYNNINFKYIADRKTGVGCDQIVIIKSSTIADCLINIYNADGSYVEMCGNAVRCIAKILMDERNLQKVTIELPGRTVQCIKQENDLVQVNMGKVLWDWQDIPLSEMCNTFMLPINIEARLSAPIAVNIGNPHTVFFGDNIDDIILSEIGNKIENHVLFPNRTNVEIAHVLSRNCIIMRVWERGVGETDACGSGACAVFAAAHRCGYVDDKVVVRLKRGELFIEYDINKNILMTGAATYVFFGIITI